jgi:hypothetical protein
MHATALDAKVAACNKANARALSLWDTMANFFVPYVGTKILKADGTLLAKIAGKMPAINSHGVHQIYRLFSNYSLCWVVRTCETSPDRWGTDGIGNYWETKVSVGDLEGDKLKALASKPNPLYYRTDWTAAEIEAARAEWKMLDKMARDARDKFSLFGEFDR